MNTTFISQRCCCHRLHSKSVLTSILRNHIYIYQKWSPLTFQSKFLFPLNPTMQLWGFPDSIISHIPRANINPHLIVPNVSRPGMTVILHMYITGIWSHVEVIKWKHFPRHWSLVREIHWSTVDSPHIRQWRESLIFSLICVWTNDSENNRDAGDFRRHRAHYDVTVICGDTLQRRPLSTH